MFKGSSSAKQNLEKSLKSEAGRFGASCHSAFPLGCCHWEAASPACMGLGLQGRVCVKHKGSSLSQAGGCCAYVWHKKCSGNAKFHGELGGQMREEGVSLWCNGGHQLASNSTGS